MKEPAKPGRGVGEPPLCEPALIAQHGDLRRLLM
jgi:hypothetical protein